MPTCMAYTPSQGYHIKKWKAKQAFYDASKSNNPCRDNNKYYSIQHGLKRDFELQEDAKSQSSKTWFDVGIFPFGCRATAYGYLVDKTPCNTLFDTGASKAMLNKKFYDEYPTLHH